METTIYEGAIRAILAYALRTDFIKEKEKLVNVRKENNKERTMKLDEEHAAQPQKQPKLKEEYVVRFLNYKGKDGCVQSIGNKKQCLNTNYRVEISKRLEKRQTRGQM